jgi:hypothetical protein
MNSSDAIHQAGEVRCPLCRASLRDTVVNGTVTFVMSCGTVYDSRGSRDGVVQSQECEARRHGTARVDPLRGANHMQYGLRDQHELLPFPLKDIPGIC